MDPVSCTALDSMELSTRTITEEGYLVAPAVLARTGIQTYVAGEFPELIKQTGMDAKTKLRLYRPPEEVFAPDAIASFEDKPVIIEPHKPVNASNWREIAVGDIRQIGKDGDNLLKASRLIVRDKKAVEAVMGGKKFLSNGYTFLIDLTPGAIPSTGEKYDGVQRRIRGNHVAITDSPRGGPVCRIADSDKGATKMAQRLVIDGIPFEAEDALAAAITKLLGERDTARNVQPSVTLNIAGTTKTVTGSDAIVKEFAALDTALTDTKKKVMTDADLDKLVNERVTVRTALIGDVAKLVPDYKPETKTNEVIMREALVAVVAGDSTAKVLSEALLGGKTLEAADATLLSTVFRAVVATKGQAGSTHSATGSGASVSAAAGDARVAAAMNGGGNGGGGAAAAKPVGRAAFLARSNNAWKGTTEQK